MFTTRLAALVAAVAISALALPGVASANTGYVVCDSTGVVFHYNTDFGRSKVVTETVNGVQKQVTVPARTATTSTWPVFGTSVVGAVWSGGKIPTQTLKCEKAKPNPKPKPPPPPPPVVPPPPPVVPPPPPPPPVETVTPPPPPVVTVTPPPPAPVTSTTPPPAPKISLRKRALAKKVPAGSTVRYQLVVKATRGTAHDVEVCDKLPNHMTYASLGTATLRDGKACWHFGELTGSLTLSLTARVDVDTKAGKLTNNATVITSDAGRDKSAATINVPAEKSGVKGKLKRAAGVTG